MKFGLFGGARSAADDEVTDSHAYGDYVDYVQEAESLGFSSVFLVEHHFTGIDQVSASINFLTYLAAKTTTIRLGTAVVVLPWHNPVLLAEQAGTLDLLSNGRFDFGIGRGYRQNEFDGFCIDMADAQDRYDEVLEVIRKAWTSDGRFSHSGKYWKFDNIVVEPTPVQKPHPPFWIGAMSEASVQKAAENGFKLLLSQTPSIDQSIANVDVYRKAVEASGRVFDPMSVGLTRALHVALDREERDHAHYMRRKFFKTQQELAGATRVKTTYEEQVANTEAGALIGTPGEIIDRLKRLEAGGVEQILMIDVTGSAAALRTFAAEVMPAFEKGDAEDRRPRAAANA